MHYRFETKLLESTLAKIGGLLQIGFGEAGTEIIRQNIDCLNRRCPVLYPSNVYLHWQVPCWVP